MTRLLYLLSSLEDFFLFCIHYWISSNVFFFSFWYSQKPCDVFQTVGPLHCRLRLELKSPLSFIDPHLFKVATSWLSYTTFLIHAQQKTRIQELFNLENALLTDIFGSGLSAGGRLTVRPRSRVTLSFFTDGSALRKERSKRNTNGLTSKRSPTGQRKGASTEEGTLQ